MIDELFFEIIHSTSEHVEAVCINEKAEWSSVKVGKKNNTALHDGEYSSNCDEVLIWMDMSVRKL